MLKYLETKESSVSEPEGFETRKLPLKYGREWEGNNRWKREYESQE